MTPDEAIEELRKRGWCYMHTHPYAGAFDQILVGPRFHSEAYGPFPQGWVIEAWGSGDTLVDAVRDALRHEQSKTR